MGVIIKRKGAVVMIPILLGAFLLLWPITTIPKLIENKKKFGFYFSKDPRIIVAKSQNGGNNLNMQNKIAFTVETICSVSLIIYGLFSII